MRIEQVSDRVSAERRRELSNGQEHDKQIVWTDQAGAGVWGSSIF
jgi:hypothetical protein